RYKIQGIPFKLSKTPAEISRPAPLIGQHTREVLTELLGLTLQDIRDGYADGTFWPARLPLYPYIEETLTSVHRSQGTPLLSLALCTVYESSNWLTRRASSVAS